MDYQALMQQLPTLYQDWGHVSIHPHSAQFATVAEAVEGALTENVLQLLNSAVSWLEPHEMYCEVGCFEGASLIGALLNHPEQLAYAVEPLDNVDADAFERLMANLTTFAIADQVIFCDQPFEEFFHDLATVPSPGKIGVYFYNAAHDYRSFLMGLLLVRPFLAEQALIISHSGNWAAMQQATWDFIAAHPQCRVLTDFATGDRSVWHGLQLLSWDARSSHTYSWSHFQQARQPALIQAIQQLQAQALQATVEHLTTAASYSLTLYDPGCQQGHGDNEPLSQWIRAPLQQAETLYQQLLQWDKTNINAWHSLGLIALELGHYSVAIERLVGALNLDPTRALSYYSLGRAFEKSGALEQAIRLYYQAIEQSPGLMQTYEALFALLHDRGDLEQIECLSQQAIRTNPNSIVGYLGLGDLLLEKNQIDDAIAIYEKGLQINPAAAAILHRLGAAYTTQNATEQAATNLGHAAYFQGKYTEAITQYERLFHAPFNDCVKGFEVYQNLANCYRYSGRHDAAIAVYQLAIKLHPEESALYFDLVWLLQESGQTEAAIHVAQKAAQVLAHDSSWQFEQWRIFPLLYAKPDEIDTYRARFSQGLSVLIQQSSLTKPETKAHALAGVARRTNFFLLCQDRNHLALQAQYGQYVHHVMAANYPQWTQPLIMPPLSTAGKIRIGYCSAYFRDHAATKLFQGWLKYHHPDFEVYCYHTSALSDRVTQQFRLYSDVFHHIPDSLEALCQQIRADDLHVLVYMDVGMNPKSIQLAGLRLAPVQCVTWGNTLTTGSPMIDYFISSDLMETKKAQAHYAETLIRLPGIGFSCLEMNIPPLIQTRADYQLGNDKIVYLSRQALFKYLPQYDYLFAAIADRVPNAQLVFVEFQGSAQVTDQFRQRLKQAFANFNLNSDDYCVILPRQSKVGYWNLNYLVDIALDSFNWAGGNTSLEALACGLPIVTCPGEFLRGRNTFGMLKALDLAETIAQDEAEYIEIAVRLGLEPNYRAKVKQQVEAKRARLFDDRLSVAALESFYRHVVDNSVRVRADTHGWEEG